MSDLSRWRGWLIAAGALVAALLLRWALDPWLLDLYPLVTLFGAIALAAFFAGTWPAIATTVAGYAAVNYFFLSPRGHFELADAAQAIGFAGYAFTAFCLIVLGGVAQRYQGELRQQALQLAESDRRKSEFIAILGHELRSPLSAVLHGAQAMHNRPDHRATVETATGLILRQARQLTRLVEELLDVSRIERDDIRLKIERVPLEEVVRQAAEASAGALEAGGHRLRLELPDPPIEIEADGQRLSQVLANLLNNAARYSPRPDEIRLAASVADSKLKISVTDHGMGIRPQDMEKLFHLFSRLEHGVDRSPGLGVGLALSRSLVELHGGSIDVHSDGPGKGSCFTVTLPLRVGARP
jgi:signal transduction histidine kinase